MSCLCGLALARTWCTGSGDTQHQNAALGPIVIHGTTTTSITARSSLVAGFFALALQCGGPGSEARPDWGDPPGTAEPTFSHQSFCWRRPACGASPLKPGDPAAAAAVVALPGATNQRGSPFHGERCGVAHTIAWAGGQRSTARR